MNTINSSLTIVPDDILWRKKIDILLTRFLHWLENSRNRFIFSFHFPRATLLSKRGMSENRIFYKKYGSIGMFAANDRVKFLRPFFHLFHCGVRKEISTNMEASTVAISSAISRSSKALPLNPKLIHSRLSQRSRIFVWAIPGREAQPPCKILVP